MTADDIIQRNAECARQLLEAGAEIERLKAERANRYWEGRYRDEAKQNELLRAADKSRVVVHEAAIRRLGIAMGVQADSLRAEIGGLKAERDDWKERYEAERRDHEATMKAFDKAMDEGP